MPQRKTTAELFGNRKTAAQLFGADVIDDNKIKPEIPSGDRIIDQTRTYRSMYEDILTGEMDWEAAIPEEKRRQIKAAFPEKYEEEGKKIINSAYFADIYGIDIDSAHITHDQLANALLKEKSPKHVFDRIKNRFNNGKLQVQIMDHGYSILVGHGNEEQNLAAIQKLQTQLTVDARADLRGLAEQMLGATAEQLPIMGEAIKESPMGAIPGAIIGASVAIMAGQAGPQISLYEEAVTVPAGAWFGIKVGGGLAAANRIRQLEAGGMYLELLEMQDELGRKIDPKIAKATAHAVGVINGGIELAEWAIILETFGIGTKVFENAAGKVTSKVFAEGTLKHVALKYALKYGAALSGEVLQEVWQESNNIVFGELAKQINNEIKGTDIKPITKEELISRIYEVASESLKGFALIVAPGTTITSAAELVETIVKPPVKKDEVVEPVKKTKEDVIEEIRQEEPVRSAEITEEHIAEPIEDEVIDEKIEMEEQETADLKKLEKVSDEKYKPSKRRPKKKIREFLSPRSTVEKVVTEYKALKMAMKKAAAAARKAFSEGKKTGVAEMKKHYKALKQAEKIRKDLRKRIDKAVKRIMKKPPMSVDFHYRKAIEVLQQGIDPKFRTKKTLEQRQKTREYLERATPEQLKDFPVELAKELNKKDLRQFTVEQLESLADNIAFLEKLGKTKKKARQAAENKILEENIGHLTKLTGTAGKIKEAPKGIDFSPEGIKQAIKSAYLWTLRIPRILDWLDGGRGTFGGLWHNLFYDQVNAKTNEELKNTDRRINAGIEKMKELGITLNELTQVRFYNNLQQGLSLTVEQIMGLYAGLKNQLAMDAIQNGNNIKLKNAKAIVSNLEKKYKDLADWIIEDYAENYPRLREAHIKETDKDLGREAFYTPMVRLEKNDYATNEELVDQLLERYGLKRGYAEKGFTIDRKNISEEHQKPIDLRLVSVWKAQTSKQEHYISFAGLTKNLRKILRDQNIKDAVTAKLGKQALYILDQYISRVANPTIYKGYDGLRSASRTARGNIAIAYLAYNLVTIAKQAPSIGLYMKDAGPAAIFSSLVEFSKNPRQIWDMVRQKDPQVKHAFIERELEELKRAVDRTKDKKTIDKIKKITATVGNKGMIGIRFVDGVVRTIGWNAVYQKALQQGLSEAEAVRLAQNSTLRTQPAAAPKDIAQLYATDEALNWLIMFTNQLNNIWNITTYDQFAYWSNKKYQDAAMTLMSISVNALLIWMIVNKKLPEDDDDLLDAATDQVLNILPLVGSGAMTGKRGWGTLSPPPIEAARATGAVISAKDKEKAALKAIEKYLVLTGIPVTAIKRTGKFAATGRPGELLGGKQKEKRISF